MAVLAFFGDSLRVRGRSSRTGEPVVKFGACGEAEAAAVLNDLDQRRPVRVFDERDDLVEVAHDVFDLLAGGELAAGSSFKPDDPQPVVHRIEGRDSVRVLAVPFVRDHAIGEERIRKHVRIFPAGEAGLGEVVRGVSGAAQHRR